MTMLEFIGKLLMVVGLILFMCCSIYWHVITTNKITELDERIKVMEEIYCLPGSTCCEDYPTFCENGLL